MRKVWKWAKGLGIGLVALVLLLIVGGWMVSKPLPTGKKGPEAEALAQKMLTAINNEAWENTGAVQWTFFRGTQHIWDKERHLAQVIWGKHRALVDINAQTGIAYTNGERVTDEKKAAKLVDKAWKQWVNDSFWLNAPSKCFNAGTERSIVTLEDGSEALMVSYTSGGATPGDSYLWLLDENGLPKAWRMWVKVLPVGGVENSWEGWTELSTGAKIATAHSSLMGTLEITGVKGTATLKELTGGEDIFAPLFE